MMESQVTAFAQMITEPSKVAMINLLMDGEFHTVNELARSAKIKPHTASYHVKRMKELGILIMEKHGRFHYYQLVNQEFAQFFEAIGAVTEVAPVRYLSQREEAKKMVEGRTCYDHLAGQLGVSVTQHFLDQGYLSYTKGKAELTSQGEQFLANEGIDVDELRKQKRQFCRMCLDWSERKHHVAGSVGRALFDLFLQKQWIIKSKKSRAIHLTDKGRAEIKAKWGLDLV